MSGIVSFLIILVVVIIAIPFYRVINGPTVFDRLLAIGAIGGKVIALILLFGLLFDRLAMFVDIALGYAILNFIAGIAMAEYFRLRREP
ncbi:MAG TPA: monovalent cation/H+ antiporter complex subunit F [Verrucomicrobiae bacterium]|jgi:multicomponent Na+:H+ antiporter subunit F|nr:monovalent cation/H+ antiporter complex subunit F [Verrucomicrobiae bacterium]